MARRATTRAGPRRCVFPAPTQRPAHRLTAFDYSPRAHTLRSRDSCAPSRSRPSPARGLEMAAAPSHCGHAGGRRRSGGDPPGLHRRLRRATNPALHVLTVPPPGRRSPDMRHLSLSRHATLDVASLIDEPIAFLSRCSLAVRRRQPLGDAKARRGTRGRLRPRRARC